MDRIIIGIHGLGNKPTCRLLKKWWINSIQEGLHRIDRPHLSFKFKMVYWADILHPQPLDQTVQDKKHPLYMDTPYVPSKDFYQETPNKIRRKILDYVEKQMDKIFLNDDLSINFSSISDYIIHHFFKDLEAYYTPFYVHHNSEKVLAKELIQQRLSNILSKYRNKRILLIAHSMGSIVAYDILSQLPDDHNIDTFITIGSPLGIPVILSRLAAEHGLDAEKRLKTPEAITNGWYNFSDLNDRVAFNYTLGDDYKKKFKGSCTG